MNWMEEQTMPDIKEKLVELMDKQKGYTLPIWTAPQTIEIMVDALIANGVTIQQDQFREVTKMVTNADRIRAMSDEELAERDVEIILGVMEQLRVLNTGDKEVAVKVRLQWLKQPAEGCPDGS